MPESPGTDLSQTVNSHGDTIQDVRERYPDTRERETLEVWHYHAIAQYEVYGLTWAEVAEIFGKSASYVCRIGNCPAGKRFREKISSLEPEEIAEVTLKAASIGATQDYMQALEWAKEARDYAAVHRMTKDLLEFADVGDRGSSDGGGQTFIINLDSADLSSPAVETSYEELDAEIVDDG